MAVLIDTSVLITLERRDLSLEALIDQFGDEDAALAAITVSELFFGAHRADTLGRRIRRATFAEAVTQAFQVLVFDAGVARIHAEVNADLAAAGQRIGTNDLMIAATALAHGFDVVTENLREFERVPGLVVRRPDGDAASG